MTKLEEVIEYLKGSLTKEERKIGFAEAVALVEAKNLKRKNNAERQAEPVPSVLVPQAKGLPTRKV